MRISDWLGRRVGQSELHLAPIHGGKHFKVTIAGKPGAAPGKGNPKPTTTLGKGFVRGQWLQAEPPVAAAYDKFIKTLDVSRTARSPFR